MLDRYEASKVVLKHAGDNPILANLGGAAGKLFAAGDRKENIYLRGSMGLASSIGLGLAIAMPNKKIIVLDGDGSVMMNMGALCTIADQKPDNFIHIIWDNEQWGETGGQPTHTSTVTNLAAVAKAAGIKNSVEVTDIAEFEKIVNRALTENGPWCIVAKAEDTKQTVRVSPFPADENLLRFLQSQKK